MSKRIVLLAGITAALALVVVAPGLAAKGGKAASTPSPSSAWVSASPNPATVGSDVTLTGCGYAFAPVSVTVTQPNGSTITFWIGMWSTGCLDTAYFVPSQHGTYTIQVFQGNNSAPAASTSVTVL
jgi:hypothetical protein